MKFMPEGFPEIPDPLAQRRLEYFYEQFVLRRFHAYGFGHFALACYASLPSLLTPDLLHKLWLNFKFYRLQGDPVFIHPVAPADLLLSPLVEEIGFELYEMVEPVRQALLKYLQTLTESPEKNRFHFHPLTDVAQFLLDYARHDLMPGNSHSPSFQEAQEWTALSYLDPSAAFAKVAKAFETAENRQEQLRYRDAIEKMAARFEVKVHHPKAEPPKGYPAMRALTQVMRDVTLRREKNLEEYEHLLQQSELLSERALEADGVVAIEISAAVREKMAAVNVVPARKVRALVVGVSETFAEEYEVEEGENEAHLFAECLIELIPRESLDITVLTGKEATKQAILDNWQLLVSNAKEQDELVFYLSSNSTLDGANCKVVCHDTLASQASSWLTDIEFQAISKNATANSVTAVLAVNHAATPHWLDEKDKRNVVFATCKQDQIPYGIEDKIDGKFYSSFTYALVMALRNAKGLASNRSLFIEALRIFENLEPVKRTYGEHLREKHTPQLLAAPAAIQRSFLAKSASLFSLQNALRRTGFYGKSSSGTWDASTIDATLSMRGKFELPQSATKQALIERLQSEEKAQEVKEAPTFLFVFGKTPATEQEKEVVSIILKKALRGASADLLILDNPTREEFASAFTKSECRNRIHWFHFAGYDRNQSSRSTAPTGFLLKDGLFNTYDFLRLLDFQENIRLVFLATCFSKSLAEWLVQLGVRAAIGTEGMLNDDFAADFSEQFYQQLANGKSIQGAMEGYSVRRTYGSEHRGVLSLRRMQQKNAYYFFVADWALKEIQAWRLLDYRQSKTHTSEMALKLIQEAKEMRLSFLDLSNCGLSEIPEEVLELDWLEELSFSKTYTRWINGKPVRRETQNQGEPNQLAKLPADLGKLRSLKTLTISGEPQNTWELNDLMPVSQLINLQSLAVGCTKISDLSPLNQLTSLQGLSIHQTPVSNLSPLKALTNLKRLYVERTQVSDLSPLAGLVSLEELNVMQTKIADLSPLSNLTNLRELNVYKTQVSDLSPLSRLVNLKELSVSATQVSDLAPLSGLENLEGLDISVTEMGDLQPIYLLLQKKLKYLNAKRCPLRNPPVEIVEQGNEAIVQYFTELEKQKTDRLYEANLMIIGEGGTGKTTLCLKLMDANSPLAEEADTTMGIDIRVLHFPMKNGRQFRMNIWNFGGQEIYYATHQFFFNKRSLYLLLDDTRRDDRSVNDPAFHYWLQVVELFGGGSPLLIVQNEKNDRSKNLDLHSIKGRFDFVQGSLAVNLLTGRGLDKLRAEIEHLIQNLPHIGSPLPWRWVRLREAVEKLAVEKDYISDEDWLRLCEQYEVDEREALQLSQYFHDLGVFLHFQDDALLSQTIILQKEWATQACYRVLDDEQVRHQKRGRFGEEDFRRIWQEGRWRRRTPQLLALILKFELCYELPDSQPRQWLVPQLLFASQPDDYHWEEHANLSLQYHYDFLPKGLLSRIIVRLHRFVTRPDLVWRSGAMLERLGAMAEIRERVEDRNVIRIRVRGNDQALRKELLVVISEEFDRLHASFSNLKVEKLIPCNCTRCQSLSEPFFYQFSDLANRRQKGKRTVECHFSYEEVDVIELLDGVGAQREEVDFMQRFDRVPIQSSAKTGISTNKKARVQDLIANNDIAEALNILQQEPENVVVAPLANQWKQLRKDEILGVLSYSDTATRRNQIIRALLEATEKMK